MHGFSYCADTLTPWIKTMKKRLEKISKEILCSGVENRQASNIKKCKYLSAYKKIECKVLIQNHCYFNTTFQKEKVVLYS